MNAPQASTPSTEGLVPPVALLLWSLKPPAHRWAPAVPSASATAAAAAPGGVGTLSNATPASRSCGRARIPVDGNQTLMAGDRVIVPEGGHANALFPGSAPRTAMPTRPRTAITCSMRAMSVTKARVLRCDRAKQGSWIFRPVEGTTYRCPQGLLSMIRRKCRPRRRCSS